jgi:CubicO group peptidase (beta-lactamase class C family)
VLQQLLEDVAGKPFPEIMRELVLQPLDMEQSTYQQPLPLERAGNAAVAHRWGGGPVEGKAHVYPEMAAAGLWTTPSDIARFAIELQLAAQGRSNKLISSKMANQMLTPQVQDDIGLGIFVSGSGDAAMFGHGGSNEGFRCDLLAFRNLGCGVVVMTNSDSGDDLIPEIRRTISEVYGWPRPEFLPREHVPIQVAPQIFAPFAGRYELKPGFLCAVTIDDRRLFFQPGDQPTFELHPESETKYFASAVELEIEFVKDENGAVNGLTFRQNGSELSAKRVPYSTRPG